MGWVGILVVHLAGLFIAVYLQQRQTPTAFPTNLHVQHETTPGSVSGMNGADHPAANLHAQDVTAPPSSISSAENADLPRAPLDPKTAKKYSVFNELCTEVGGPRKPYEWDAPAEGQPENGMFVVWAVFSPLPIDAIWQVMKEPAGRRLYCATEHCRQAGTSLGMDVRSIVTTTVCDGTPMKWALMNQAYFKVMLWKDFRDFVQDIVSLCILWRDGGQLVRLHEEQPMAAAIVPAVWRRADLPTYWVPQNGDLFSGCSLPRHSEVVSAALVELVRTVPCVQRNISNDVKQLAFPRRDVVRTAVTAVLAAASGAWSLEKQSPLSWHAGMLARLDWVPGAPFGAMDYEINCRNDHGNKGDETQSFGPTHFLPHIDVFVDREAMLSRYKKPQQWRMPNGSDITSQITIVLNAWYDGTRIEWPPGPGLNPIMVSMYFGPGFVERISKKKATHDVFLEHSPIGARDLHTLEVMKQVWPDVPSFFSACGTQLIRNPSGLDVEREDFIFVVDAKPNLVAKIVPEEEQHKIVNFKQMAKKADMWTTLKRFDMSWRQVTLMSRAKLVITSRIHSALPSLGMGTPVIFISTAGSLPGASRNIVDTRTAGLVNLFHQVTESKETGELSGHESFKSWDWRHPPLSAGAQQRDRFRTAFWNLLRQHDGIRDAGRFFGMVPFIRAKGQAGLFFHVLVTSTHFSSLDLRSIETCFHAYPDAKVFVRGRSIGRVDVDILLDGGYDVEVRPAAGMAMAMAEKLKLKEFSPDEMSQLEAAMEKDGLAERLGQLVDLYVHGGVALDSDIFLRQSFTGAENNFVALAAEGSQPGSLGLLKFEAQHPLVAQVIRALIGKSSRSSLQLPSLVKELSASHGVAVKRDGDFLLQRPAELLQKICHLTGEGERDKAAPEAEAFFAEAKLAGAVRFHLKPGAACSKLLDEHCIVCSNILR
mmetsp:Transcript_15316/g.33094  ORF Transcript_15316/g.33094 Transcript_15316/m.33094 type:complete len:934 (-) Transcript_15316:182-2983(-)